MANLEMAGFFRARLDEDEARALKARDEWDAEWVGYEWNDLPDEVYAHARAHDPARVLREVVIKRAILDAYLEQDGYNLPPGVHDGRDDSERLRDESVLDALDAVVRALISGHDGHLDYKPEWKP